MPLMAAHLEELMGDAELYGLECVHAFHAVWLQQLEHCCSVWADEDEKLQFQSAHIWHKRAAYQCAYQSLKRICAHLEKFCHFRQYSLERWV